MPMSPMDLIPHYIHMIRKMREEIKYYESPASFFMRQKYRTMMADRLKSAMKILHRSGVEETSKEINNNHSHHSGHHIESTTSLKEVTVRCKECDVTLFAIPLQEVDWHPST